MVVLQQKTNSLTILWLRITCGFSRFTNLDQNILNLITKKDFLPNSFRHDYIIEGYCFEKIEKLK